MLPESRAVTTGWPTMARPLVALVGEVVVRWVAVPKVSVKLAREVIRHLAVRDHGRGLSSGERQLYAQAKRLLASEVQYARGTDEDEALVWIEGVLASVSYEQVAEAAHLE